MCHCFGVVHFADGLTSSVGLKGPQQSSPGQSETAIAVKRRPGLSGQWESSPEGAKQTDVSPLQGSVHSNAIVPGASLPAVALPQADLLRPFRPK